MADYADRYQETTDQLERLADRPYSFNGSDRLAREELCGYSLYLGGVEDGEFRGTHKGLVKTAEEAQAWVDGDDDLPIITIYPGRDG